MSRHIRRGVERTTIIRLYLINPRNPLVSLTHVKESRWNRYRVWKPLGLLVLAGLTPPEWEISIFDENTHAHDYERLPRPDLVGVTAFTSQANRAYEIATEFRRRGVPVVMGGIHATMRPEEAAPRVDAVVTGEAERVWGRVLADAERGDLRPLYAGEHADMETIPPARHDLLVGDYACGAIQTTRGCPLSCSFCSVTAFNGHRYRQRPIDQVVREFVAIRERLVLIVDDNLIGTKPEHIARAKELFRALIAANSHKQWIAQVTINIADDEELLELAARAGCTGVFIGFESVSPEGMRAFGGKRHILEGRDFRASVRRIQRHKILVVGSFIIGLDTDQPGVGRRIADAATRYGLDVLNTLFLTPLPGTRLWDDLEAADRLAPSTFPEDWKYYTLTFPVARYQHFSRTDIVQEMQDCDGTFYSLPRIVRRVWSSFWRWRKPFTTLVSNFSYRSNLRLGRDACRAFLSLSELTPASPPPA